MSTNAGNVRWIHAECAATPSPEWTRKPLDWFVGKAVKMKFQSADSPVEQMWVVVTHVDDNDLVGTLKNEPVYVHHVAYGDRVVLNRTQVIDVECLGS